MAQQDSYQTLVQHYEGNQWQWKHQTSYAVCQPNGQVLGLLNPKGRVVWRKEKQTLWGLRFPNSYHPNSPLDPQMLFAGQWIDEESGLAYNRFRYYDPESGNYISSDPIGLQGGETPYGYVNNPIGWTDPFGLARCHGLPSTRKPGKTGKNYDPLNGQGLYVLRDSIGNIKYVGRGDVHARKLKHAKDPTKSTLIQDIIFDNNLTKAEAKYLEEKLMGIFGGPKSANPTTNLENAIRSYSRSNTNASIYNIAGDSKGWGKEILRDALDLL